MIVNHVVLSAGHRYKPFWTKKIDWVVGRGVNAGVNKKPKKIQNFLAWISDNLKTVWQGESGKLKTVCWYLAVQDSSIGDIVNQ